MSGKSQDYIVSLLRNIEVGSVVHLTVSRQTSDDHTGETSTTRPFDSTDSINQEPALTSAPPGETKEKQSNNGASSPVLRCLATKTDENDNPVVDSNLELIELSIAVGEDDSEKSSGLGISIKGMSSGRENPGLYIKKIIDGRAAAKVCAEQRCWLVKQKIMTVASAAVIAAVVVVIKVPHSTRARAESFTITMRALSLC